MARVDSRTASNPGPRPATQLLIMTAAKKTNHGGPFVRGCSNSITSKAAATQHTARPYLVTVDAIRRAAGANFGIPSPPLAGMTRQYGSRELCRTPGDVSL